MERSYEEKIDGLYMGWKKLGPLSLGDDVMKELASLEGCTKFSFGGREAPVGLITGVPKTLKRLGLDNWDDVREDVAKVLMEQGVECGPPGPGWPVHMSSPVRIGPYCWTYENRVMRLYSDKDE